MESSFDRVIASYHRARENGGLFETFYELFLAKSPDIRSMFARTDFPHQRLMLRESILEMLLFAQNGSGRNELERIGQRHRTLNISAQHYELWLDALCQALGKHDCEFGPKLEHLWRDAMRKGIDVISAS